MVFQGFKKATRQATSFPASSRNRTRGKDYWGNPLWAIATLNERLKVFISLRLPTKPLYLFDGKR